MSVDYSMSGIFCEHGPRAWRMSDVGLLKDSKIAVKDLFHLAGERNSAGNPDWYQHAPIATQTAPSLQTLLGEGAEFVGFTHTDELAYSLEGNNTHYGAAENPRAKGHACGGSSMGSAAAVAAGMANIGLGTDTGGSVRVPASYCGLYGIRPSHGAVSTEGVIGLAPPFDTVGWFTPTMADLERVGQVLLPSKIVEVPTFEVANAETVKSKKSALTLVVCEALFDWVAPELRPIVDDCLHKCSAVFENVNTVSIDPSLLNRLADSFRVLQGRAIALEHGDWIRNANPTMAPAIKARFDMALALTEKEEAQARKTQRQWQETLSKILDQDSVLFLPTTPTTAPKLNADTRHLRMQILSLTAMAGLTGSAQIHLPLASSAENLPYGFSLLMPKGCDHQLIQICKRVVDHFGIIDKMESADA